MDFKKIVRTETDNKYVNMLDGNTQTPYTKEPLVNGQKKYKENRERYYQRLGNETKRFNESLKAINDRRTTRLNNETRAKNERGYKNFKWQQVLKTVAFFLPVVLAFIVGLDIFNKTNGYKFKLKAMGGLSWSWVITLYVIFCLVAVGSAIILTCKMFANEEYRSWNVIYEQKPYTVSSIVVLVITLIIIAFNLVKLVSYIGDNKIIFEGGDFRKYERVEKGEEIILPTDYVKSDAEFKEYSSQYVLIGWEIDGTTYTPGTNYKPSGNERIKAIFREDKFCSLKASASGYSIIAISYEDFLDTVSVDDDNYEIIIPYGTSVTISYEHKGNGDRNATLNGANFSSPHTYNITCHSSVWCSSSDTGCLVEGTQIAMKNGQTKAIEDLQIGDVLAIFNHETGKFDYAPLLVNVHAKVKAKWQDVINLYFSDGTHLKIVDEHGLYNKELNQYVYIKSDNAFEFIGQRFASTVWADGEIKAKEVILERVAYTREYIKIFNPATVWHINLIANNMLTLSAGMVNLFEYDEGMGYNQESMQKDIRKYGLYTYEDFKDYISIEVFNAFPFKYYKVAVGKGIFTYEEVLELITFYMDSDSVK